MPGRVCRCTAAARILAVRVGLPGAGRRVPAPPNAVELLNRALEQLRRVAPETLPELFPDVHAAVGDDVLAHLLGVVGAAHLQHGDAATYRALEAHVAQ